MLLSNRDHCVCELIYVLKDKQNLLKQLHITEEPDSTLKTDPIIKKEKDKLDFTKKTVEELNRIISDGAVMGASQVEKTNARKATAELKHREKSLQDLQKFTDAYNKIIESAHEIEKMNFADKLSQTEQEIKLVNDRYNAEIKKIKEFMTARENAKLMTPEKTATLNTEIGKLEIERQAQVNQVLEQAEKDFAEKIKQIHENLRVARMAITTREVYEINKKYDDLQKEIIDAIQYRYDQEVLMANGDTGKILVAEKNKADALAKVQDDLAALNVARNEEKNKALKNGDERFEEELRTLKLKGEEDIAKGKEKIQLQVDSKYKKILADNVGNEKKTHEIKLQMEAEYNAEVLKLKEEAWKKELKGYIQMGQALMETLSAINTASNAYDDQALQKDEAANNQKKDNLKKRLDSGTISQKEYDNKIAKMDLDMHKKKSELTHQQAVRQKEIMIMNAIIAGLLAVVQAMDTAPPLDVIMPIVIGALAAIQIAAIIATPVPEAAAGRYDVIGQEDGKTYKNVPYSGKPKTGLYKTPTLISESGREIVIDSPTTDNLIMNYPDVIRAIKYASTGAVPQHAAGDYPDIDAGGSSGARIIYMNDPEHTAALKENNELLKKEKFANVVFDDFRRAQKKIDDIESSASKNS